MAVQAQKIHVKTLTLISTKAFLRQNP